VTAWWIAFVFASAPSEQDVLAAKLLFESGKRAFDHGEYDASIAAFEQAQEIAPRPALYFSMAQAYRLRFFDDGKVKGLREAARLYARYLAEEPKGRRRADAVEHLATVETILIRRGDAEDEDVEDARKTQIMVSSDVPAVVRFRGEESPAPLIREVTPGPHTATVSAAGYHTQVIQRVAVLGRLVVAHVELEPLPARLSVDGPEGASVLLDGDRAGELPLRIQALPAGEHALQILDRGKEPYERSVSLARGEEASLTIELEDTSQRAASYWLLGAGGAAAAGGAVFLALALAAENRAIAIQDRLRAGEGLSAEDIAQFGDEGDARDDFKLVSAPLLVSSAVTLAIGLLLYFLDEPDTETTLEPSPDRWRP
jgi:hypothetical protein